MKVTELDGITLISPTTKDEKFWFLTEVCKFQIRQDGWIRTEDGKIVDCRYCGTHLSHRNFGIVRSNYATCKNILCMIESESRDESDE